MRGRPPAGIFRARCLCRTVAAGSDPVGPRVVVRIRVDRDVQASHPSRRSNGWPNPSCWPRTSGTHPTSAGRQHQQAERAGAEAVVGTGARPGGAALERLAERGCHPVSAGGADDSVEGWRPARRHSRQRRTRRRSVERVSRPRPAPARGACAAHHAGCGMGRSDLAGAAAGYAAADRSTGAATAQGL